MTPKASECVNALGIAGVFGILAIFLDGFGISKERYIDEILDWNFNFYYFIANIFLVKMQAVDIGYLPPACVSMKHDSNMLITANMKTGGFEKISKSVKRLNAKKRTTGI